jgi:glutamyl/glutaminyl-tRNA synthetase
LIGLKRRGILPEAIRKFVLSLSITLSETKPSMEILESFNRKLLDPTSLRLFFVKDPIELHIDKLDMDFIEMKNHPTLEMGKRTIDVEKIIYISNDDAIKLKIGDTVRLMDLCNIEITQVDVSNEKEENSKNNNYQSQNNNTYDFYNTIKEDTNKIVNEFARSQPTYIQAISNLQMKYIEATKNIINSTLGFQKQVFETMDYNSSTTYTKQLGRQSNEITNNIVEFNNINNKFISNVFEVAGDGIKNYTKTLDTIVKFNANVFDQWYLLFKNNQSFIKP